MDLYLSSLQATEHLLDRVGEVGWRDWIKEDIKLWQQSKDVYHHLQAYGGMLSFNDLVISVENGCKIDEALQPWINLLLSLLRSLSLISARLPKYALELLQEEVSHIEVEGHGGWRCIKCGYSQTSEKDINGYIARIVLPKIFIDACINNKLLPLVDRVFNQDLPNVEHLKLKIKDAAERSSMVLVEKIENWMRPCPICGSNETELGSWWFDEKYL